MTIHDRDANRLIVQCHVIAYLDSGRTMVCVVWESDARTIGDFESSHMRALVRRALREGMHVTSEVRQ